MFKVATETVCGKKKWRAAAGGGGPALSIVRCALKASEKHKDTTQKDFEAQQVATAHLRFGASRFTIHVLQTAR